LGAFNWSRTGCGLARNVQALIAREKLEKNFQKNLKEMRLSALGQSIIIYSLQDSPVSTITVANPTTFEFTATTPAL
jgi:hypothetical protein